MMTVRKVRLFWILLTVTLSLRLGFVSSQEEGSNTTTPTTPTPTTPTLATFAPTLAPTLAPIPDTTSPTVAATIATATATPTGAPSFASCSVCATSGQQVTNLEGVYNDKTCQEWQSQGLNGLLSSDDCSALQSSVSFDATCDCSSTATATLSPTMTPLTPAPYTQAPSQAFTTSSPTAVTAIQQIDVILILQNVATAMSPVHANYFGPALALYLQEQLRPRTTLGPGWTGVLNGQLLLGKVPDPNENNNRVRNRRQRQLQRERQRQLQGSSANNNAPITVSAPLATRTTITATQLADTAPLDPETVQFYIESELEGDGGMRFLQHMLNQTESPTLLVYFEKIKNVTLFPADSQVLEGPGRGVNVEGEDDGDDDEFLSLWAIVGIAGGIGVCLLLIAATMLLVMQPETINNSPRRQASSPRQGIFSTSPTNNNNKSATVVAAPSGGEDDTTYYGNASVLNPPTITPHDADNQSYAYSLEPGNFTETATLQSRQAAVSSSLPPPSSKPVAVVPPTRAASAPDVAVPEDPDVKSFSTRRGPMVSRQINAPPGKLGIVIDTSLEGPIVHKVNENSPLRGTIFPGDIITSINGIDTRAMKASAITTIMVRTAHEPRVLTVASEDTTQMR